MSRRKRRMKAARIEADRDRLSLEVIRLRGQNLTLMLELASMRERSAVLQPRRARGAQPDVRPYQEIRMARHVARVELRNAAARYGRLANRRTRKHADQDDFDRAKRELDEAAQAFVGAEQLLANAELEVAREAGLASASTSHGDRT
jgi:hypothetical protein